jgi:hypothetical protein
MKSYISEVEEIQLLDFAIIAVSTTVVPPAAPAEVEVD